MRCCNFSPHPEEPPEAASRRIAAVSLAAALVLSACGGAREIGKQSAEPDAEALTPGDEVPPMRRADAPFYVGVWAVDPAVCALAPGSAVPSPIAITAREFLGYENRCRIAGAQEGTEGGWRLALVCRAAGVETQETIEVDVDGAMLRLRRGANETAYVRCKEE